MPFDPSAPIQLPEPLSTELTPDEIVGFVSGHMEGYGELTGAMGEVMDGHKENVMNIVGSFGGELEAAANALRETVEQTGEDIKEGAMAAYEEWGGVMFGDLQGANAMMFEAIEPLMCEKAAKDAIFQDELIQGIAWGVNMNGEPLAMLAGEDMLGVIRCESAYDVLYDY